MILVFFLMSQRWIISQQLWRWRFCHKKETKKTKTIKLQEQVKIVDFLPPTIHDYSFESNHKKTKGQRTILTGYPVGSPHRNPPTPYYYKFYDNYPYFLIMTEHSCHIYPSIPNKEVTTVVCDWWKLNECTLFHITGQTVHSVTFHSIVEVNFFIFPKTLPLS